MEYVSVLNEEYTKNMDKWDKLNIEKYESIQNGYKIPNVVHYTFSTTVLPVEIYKVIKNNKKICSGCQFIFYNDTDCDNFIKKYFNEVIYNAFNKINPKYGAMKADFFRYCVLYIIGGIYIDIKSFINTPLFILIQKDDECILDIPRVDKEPWRSKTGATFEQWLLIFSPKHPYLLEMIEQMVEYINTKYYPIIDGYQRLNTKQQILNVTGPDAFAKAIKKTILKNNKELHRCIDYDKHFMISLGETYKKMYYINNKKHYSEINEPLYK
jgi:mannosyltransferase OCH1-like enzyme